MEALAGRSTLSSSPGTGPNSVSRGLGLQSVRPTHHASLFGQVPTRSLAWGQDGSVAGPLVTGGPEPTAGREGGDWVRRVLGDQCTLLSPWLRLLPTPRGTARRRESGGVGASCFRTRANVKHVHAHTHSHTLSHSQKVSCSKRIRTDCLLITLRLALHGNNVADSSFI